MNRQTLLLLAAACALAGCDLLPGDKVEVSGNAAANASAGNASAAAAPASAGITSSRSLAGLTGGDSAGAGDGGKDPDAIPAGATRGLVDPRLVGSWTDTGDCKVTVELRPDGSFVANTGGGRWAVEGDDLVFSGNGQTYRLRLDAVEADRIRTTDQDGRSGQSTRC
jgi:hypothetical protein